MELVGKGGTLKKPPLYVAIHEAGHAVLMMFHHPATWIDHITLRDLPDNAIGNVKAKARFQLSFVEYLTASGALTEEHRTPLAKDAWQDVIELMAGTIAELRFRKCCAAARLIEMRLGVDDAAKRVTGIGSDDFEKIHLRLEWLGGDVKANLFKA